MKEVKERFSGIWKDLGRGVLNLSCFGLEGFLRIRR